MWVTDSTANNILSGGSDGCMGCVRIDGGQEHEISFKLGSSLCRGIKLEKKPSITGGCCENQYRFYGGLVVP